MPMAYTQQILTNPKSGQTIKFLQTSRDTGGQLVEMESTLRGYSTEPPLHYHPFQDEKFSIIEGELTVRLNGVLKTFTSGSEFLVPRNTLHSMWNQSNDPVVMNWKVSPALNTEHFFENTFGIAANGKTNEKGMPGILQIALLANKYDNTFRLAKPPFYIQKIIFSLLTPFAYLAGYRASYDKYMK